jgi:membrane-associated phospholipid phosphatase
MHALMQVISGLDISVYNFLNGFAGNRLLCRLVEIEEGNNLSKGGLFFVLYVYLWFRVGPDQENRRRAIVAILTATLLALVASRTVADLTPFRIRPMYDPSISHQVYALPVSANLENWSAFPSDTATYFSALAFGLAFLWRRYTVPIVLYTAVWICLPRLFYGAHWASDIGFGAAIGITMVWASLRSVWLRSNFAARVLGFMDAKPQIFYAAAFLVCFEMAVVFYDVRSLWRALWHATFVGPHQRELFQSALAGLALIGFATIVVCVVSWARHRLSSRNA